jgi:ribosomal protein S18 acetylase RimI-like enzyme
VVKIMRLIESATTACFDPSKQLLGGDCMPESRHGLSSDRQCGCIGIAADQHGATMLIQISPATISDIDDLTRLNRIVQDAHVQMHADIFRADWDVASVKEFWRVRLQDEASAVAIAMHKAIPVGYIWFEIQERITNQFTHGKRRIQIHHVSVDEEWRRHGIGSALFEYVEEQAKRLGIVDVTLDTWHANASAQAFFASREYVPIKLVLTKFVGG